MSAINTTPSDVRSDSVDGQPRRHGVFVGVVKDNNDSQRMGRLAVYIPDFGGDPDVRENWYVVNYASPFAGATDVEKNKASGKEMADTQTSYGFWMVPPDLNNMVLCTFINGDPARGYWFACLYQTFMNHMVPGVALNVSTHPEINEKNLPPVCEYNKKDKQQNVWDPTRPPFEPLHNALATQGLYNDPERGPQTTSARREAPSKVFGFLTPHGNSFSVDEDPDNEFIRLRTRSGVQLLIHETTGYIYMISKQGNSWFELSDEGINMYSKGSISMRSEENVNIHSDQNVMHMAGGAIHHTASNLTHRSHGRITSRADGDINRRAPTIRDNSTTPGGPSGASGASGPGGGASGPGGPGGGGSGRNQSGITSVQDAQQYSGRFYGESQQCVALVKQFTGVGQTSGWVQGDQVMGNSDLQPGTAIATFGPNGTYTNTYGQSHAAIYLGQDSNGIQVLDQWNGHPASVRTISFSNSGAEGGSKFYVIGNR